MKNLIHTAVVTLFAASAAHAQQAVQWKVSDGGNGHWYLLATQGKRNWIDARSWATSIGGHLVTFQSKAEWDFIWPRFNGSDGYWIGLFQDPPTGLPPDQGWRWVTEEPLAFTAWAPGEPNDWIGYQQWVVQAGNQYWDDTIETGVQVPVIEWDADCNSDGIVDYGQTTRGQLPDYDANGVPDCCERGETCVTGNYPVQWKVSDGGNGHWYLFDQAVMHWQPHRDRAAAIGGYLGTITSASEQTFVESVLFIQEADIWLGGVSNWPQPVAWITGEPVSFTYWQQYNPGGGYAFEMCGRSDCLLRFGWNIESENSDGWPGNKGLYEWDADCNNDNVVDYGQILQGQLADANTNGVPDICEVPTCHDIDLNLNGIVEGGDLGVLLAFWGTVSPAFPRADINSDGLVNGADLGILLAFWGTCPN